MGTFIKSRRAYAIIILIGLVVAVITLMGRHNIEKGNTSADIMLDYDEINLLAEQSGEDVSLWLDFFYNQGIRNVGLIEESLDSMIKQGKPLKANIMKIVAEDLNYQESLPEELIKAIHNKNNKFDPNDILVSSDSKEIYDFIMEGFQKRYPEEKILYAGKGSENTYYILIDGTLRDTLFMPSIKLSDTYGKAFSQVQKYASSKLMSLSLGLDREKIDRIESSQMNISPRTTGYDGWNGEKFQSGTIEEYSKLSQTPNYLIFSGLEIIGEDAGSYIIQEYIEENGILTGIIEDTTQRGHINQEGLTALVESLNYKVVRTFTTWPYIQQRYQYYHYEGSEEIENTFFRAITERNIRLIYFKPIKEKDDDFIYITEKAEYEKMFDGLKDRINEHHITIGKASTMEPYTVGLLQKIIMTFGSVAAGVLLLNAIIKLKEKFNYGLLGLACLGVIGAYFLAPNFSNRLSSLAASIIFPSLAILYLFHKCKELIKKDKQESIGKIIIIALKTLVIASLISLLGALIIAALNSDITYLLELEFFRGIKIAQLAPILILAILYLAKIGMDDEKKMMSEELKLSDIKAVLSYNIKVWIVMLIGIVGIAGYFYMARTGHETGIEPLEIEMIFRNFLEEVLIARPRSKEFLIAFPSLMVVIYIAARQLNKWLLFVFALAAVIGQTSIVNTFMHIRTPLYMSLYRTGFSVAFGIILGAIGMLIIEGIVALTKRFIGETKNA